MFSKEDLQIEAYPQEKTELTFGLSSGVKVTHKATGIIIIVNRHRNMHKNKEEAFRILQSQLRV